MGTCSIENCKNECFEQEDKCILHCHKNQKNSWYTLDKNNKKIWDSDKLKLFWERINTEISGINSVVGDKDVFKSIVADYNHDPFQYEFKKVIFPKSIISDIQDKSFYGLDKDINIDFNKCIFLDFTDFELISKAKNATFYNCRFFENIEFKQIEFNGIFLFENCKVCQDIKFQNITFKKTTSFISSKFHKKLNFIHSRFDDLALFNDIKAEELLLDNTFFRGEANFLHMTAKMANRETARIIKDSFEKQNNIIEANKFYALEMKEMENELKFLKNPSQWFVFKFHSISSDHSQDWVLALSWIVIIGMLYTIVSFCGSDLCLNNINTPIMIGSIFAVSIYSLHVYDKSDYKQFTKYIFLFLLFVNYFAITKDVTLSCLADKINPFSIMTSKDPISFGLLLFKVTIAYLIYQFIVSVRQNTRRK